MGMTRDLLQAGRDLFNGARIIELERKLKAKEDEIERLKGQKTKPGPAIVFINPPSRRRWPIFPDELR